MDDDDFLIDTNYAIRTAKVSRSYWHDIHNAKSPRFDPAAPPKIKISPRVVRYKYSDFVRWISSKVGAK